MNRFICHGCGKEFEWLDKSDEIWKLFCGFGCCFGYFRARAPKPWPAPPFAASSDTKGEEQKPSGEGAA